MTSDKELEEAYLMGYRDGLKCFAWWKDGTEYVGSGMYTLKDALKRHRELYNCIPTRTQQIRRPDEPNEP